MPLTIDELVIEATVDPTKIKRGLDQGGTHLKDFAADTARTLSTLPTKATQTGREIAEAIVASASTTFREKKAQLTVALLDGTISQAEFNRKAAQLAQGFNQTLVEGLKTLSVMKSGAGLVAIEELTTKIKMEGVKAGEQYSVGVAEGVEQGSNRIMIAGRDMTMRLSSVAVGAAFAFEQMAEGAGKGEGAMRRVLRSVGILGLAIGGPEGVLIGAIALGSAALMSFLGRAEREAKKAADEIRKHIADAANAGKGDDIVAQARIVEFGQPYKDGKPQALSSNEALAAQGVYSGSLRDLQAQYDVLKQIRDEKAKGGLADRDAYRNARDQLEKLLPLLNTQKQLMADLRFAAEHMASAPGPNAGQAAGIDVTAQSPNVKGGKDRGPYADLKDQIGELTTAYEAMVRSGIKPTIELQTQLEDAFLRTTHMLRDLKDQSGPAANALRAILADMEGSGMHARDNMLAGGSQFAGALPDGTASASVDALIERLKTVREATGDFSLQTIAAQSQLAHMLDGVNVRIEQQGGLLKASLDLLKAQKAAAGALAEPTKSLPGMTPAEVESLNKSITASMRDLNGLLKDNNDQWSAMRSAVQGVVDAASGFASIPGSLRDITNGLLHAIDIAKQVQALRAPAKDGKPAGDGLMSIAGLAVGVGALGAGISIISGLKSLFGGDNSAAEQARQQIEQEHNQLLAQNNQKLAELALTMAGYTGGQNDNTAVKSEVQGLIDFLNEKIRLNGGNTSSGRVGLQGTDTLIQGGKFDWDEIMAIAKRAGISLTDSQGFTDPKLLQQFLDYINQSNSALRTFDATLSDQTSLANLKLLVSGKNGASDTLNSTIALLKQFAPKLGASLDGIDTTTKEGRAQLRSALEALVDAIAAGTIPIADFGDLAGAKDLAGLITTIAQSLNSMDTAVNNVTGSLTNVPTWYKVNLARFNAADAENPQSNAASMANRIGIGGSGPGGPNDIGATGRPGTKTVLGMLTGGGASSAPTYNITGDILVDARALSADEIFAAVLQSAQRAAQTQFGDSTEWSQVQRVRT